MTIGGEAVYKICSGQDALSLAVALKELLENSLDSGASVVDIRLRECGSELMEVVDNGIGIHPNNFEALEFRALIRLKRDEPNNSTIRENISYVFGPKQLSTLLEIVMTEPSQDILEEFKIDNQYENIFRL